MLSPRSGKNIFLEAHQPIAPADSLSDNPFESQHNMMEDDQMREGILLNVSIFADEKPPEREPLPIQTPAIDSSENLIGDKDKLKVPPESGLVVTLPILAEGITPKKSSPKASKEEVSARIKDYFAKNSPVNMPEEIKDANINQDSPIPMVEDQPQTLNTKVTIPLLRNVLLRPSETKSYNQLPQLDEEKATQITKCLESTLKSANEEKKYASYCTNFLSRVRLQ